MNIGSDKPNPLNKSGINEFNGNSNSNTGEIEITEIGGKNLKNLDSSPNKTDLFPSDKVIEIEGEDRSRTLWKITESVLGIFAKFGVGKKYLETRKQQHSIYYQKKLHEPFEKSKVSNQIEQNVITSGLITVDEKLFVTKEEIKKGGEEHFPFTAKMAVEKGNHTKVNDLSIPGLEGKDIVPYSFETGKITSGNVAPTSYILGKPEMKDQLTNIYVLKIDDKQVVIRTGVINSKNKAEAFTALIKEIYKGYDVGTKGKIRIVSQQLNSFENESKLINDQHQWIAKVNQDLNNIAEVVHINTPSNRWYHTTRRITSWGCLGSLIKKLAPRNLFKGEDLSKEQNMDSVGTYVKWMWEDLMKNQSFKDLPNSFKDLSNQNNIKNLYEKLSKFQEKYDILKGNVDYAVLNDKKKIKELRIELRKLLKESYIDIKNLEDYLASQQDLKELSPIKNTLSLCRQMLGSQLGIKEEVLDRGKEGMVLQKLNDKLGIVSAMNCKSGLDRTGLWHSIKLAMLAFEEDLKKEGVLEDQIEERSFALVNDWETTTNLMNKMSVILNKDESLNDDWLNSEKTYDAWKGKFGSLISKEQFDELKVKMQDVAKVRNYVLVNLVDVALPITQVSTGLVGLKWNSGFKENLVPLNFLPSKVKLEEDENKKVSLVRYGRGGKVEGIANRGRRLLNKFQKLRGS